MEHGTRKHVYFTGNVQGVGFRFTTRGLAGGYNVTGFVKNLSDGRVEVVAEGDKTEVDGFIDELRDEMSHYIRKADVSTEQPTGEFTDFGVRR